MNPMTLISILENHTVFIQTHNFPDPDAISSAFGLQQFLSCYGIEAVLCYDGRIDRVSSKKMLDTFGITMFSKSELLHMKESDYIILVCGFLSPDNRHSHFTGMRRCPFLRNQNGYSRFYQRNYPVRYGHAVLSVSTGRLEECCRYCNCICNADRWNPFFHTK